MNCKGTVGGEEKLRRAYASVAEKLANGEVGQGWAHNKCICAYVLMNFVGFSALY
jgi:hypothetical protein